MKRVLFLAILFATVAFAQTAAITAPTASQVINADGTGYQFTLASTCASCGAVYSAEYQIDGERIGISRTPPYAYAYLPYYQSNGQHSIDVIYRDILNNVLATSPTVPFSVENNLPQGTCGTTCTDITVTTGLIAPFTVTGFGGSFAGVTVSFFGSGSVALVPHGGNGYCAIADSPASGVLNCGTTIAGNLLAAYFRWQSATGTLTCATNNGGTVGYSSAAQNSSGFTAQFCYVANIGGGASTTLTATTTAGAVLNGFAFEISGAATSSPLDVNVTGNTTSLTTSPFNPAHSAANEIFLAGGSWNSASAAIAPKGWSAIYQDTNQNSAVAVVNPTASPYGTEQISTTVNGPNSGISKVFTAFVDGLQVAQASAITAATETLNVNTTAFLNESHHVVVRVDGGNCSGCAGGTWSDMGAWEQQQTFGNALVPSQLLMSAREVQLTAGGSSQTITGTDLNTDGSTTAATITACTIDPSPLGSYFTVALTGGACVVTPTSTAGDDYITATDSNGLTRQFWVFTWALGTNTIPNFGTDGQIHSGYVSNSIWRASPFSSGTPFDPLATGVTSSQNQAAQWGPGYAWLGFNTIETGCEIPGATQTAYGTAIANDISVIGGNLSSYGLGRLKYVHLICDSLFRTTAAMFATIMGPSSCNPNSSYAGCGSGWTSAAFPQLVQAWVNSGIVQGIEGIDEVGGSFGGTPLLGINTGGVVIGTNNLTQISGNGTTCTMAWGPLSSNDHFTGANAFFITGSGTALDYVSSTNSPLYTYTSRTSSTITWPCGYTGTITTGAAQVQTYSPFLFNASGVACSATSGNTSGGFPCTYFVPNNSFQQIRTWLTSVANFPPLAFPLAGGGYSYGIANWSGASQVAGVRAGDYWEQYFPGFSSSYYLPGFINSSTVISVIGDTSRVTLNYTDRTAPVIGETSGVQQAYLTGPDPAGVSIAVSSCVGNLITTAVPHTIHNVIFDFTKITVSGSSGGLCDGTYYVIGAPTSTTLSVVLANATSGTVVNTGTITFSPSGNSYTLQSLNPSTSGNGPGNFAATITSTCPNTWKSNVGQTFTLSAAPSITGWFDAGSTTSNCASPGAGGESFWRQVPNITASTGGTGYIMLNGWYTRGPNWPTNSDTGPRLMFANINEGRINRWAGIRNYQTSIDPQYSDLTLVGSNGALTGPTSIAVSRQFGGTNFASQAQLAALNPVVDFGQTRISAQSNAPANLLAERNVKYSYQPGLNSPDYGTHFEAAMRGGTFGNELLIQHFADGATSLVPVNLSACGVTGQSIIVFASTWDGIQSIRVLAPGTMTDSHAWAPVEFRDYICPQNSAAELNQPSISVRLAAVTNATDVVIQYSYSPLSFTSPSVASQTLYQTYNCGTGNCTLPTDRNIGTIYYRIIYYGSGNAVLATSDVQTL
jgi:hypothetical protein